MNNKYTFIDLFKDSNGLDAKDQVERVKLESIVIPIIQRDYAQGRKSSSKVRKRFLNALKNAIIEKPIILDFVYGDMDSNGKMTPLDGQQRLTTLFLLHWYAAKKENIAPSECSFLEKFSYESRYSATEFCEKLVKDYNPSFEVRLSEELKDQTWFPLSWEKNSTVRGMLVMLDAIQEEFKDIDAIWEKLKDGAISFYFEALDDLGLTDDIYIKMNSRGKPLSDFELFKAELERELNEYDEKRAKEIISKIDNQWTNMLWDYKGENNIIDDEFLRYFKFICDIICYKNGGTTLGRKQDEYEIIQEYFGKTNEETSYYLDLLESYFDCWCELKSKDKDGIDGFFQDYFVKETHEEGKARIDDLHLFKDCLENYANVYSNGKRSFPLNKVILLYAVIEYLTNQKSVTETQFRRRIRIVSNLVKNSTDEISERTSDNRMPAILKQVDSIILNGAINDNIGKNFNAFQLEEEKTKDSWVNNNPENAEALYTLEDHALLDGQISIVGLDHPELFEKFASLFACDRDLVDRALLATGDYKQCERNGWRYQLGSSAINIPKPWISLFHKSANYGFDNTKKVLAQLLSKISGTPEETLEKIVNSYIKDCEDSSEYPWQYYYIKYKAFRPGRYGKCSWKDTENGYYNMHTLNTEHNWSENSYNPFLYEAKQNSSRENMGEYAMVEGDLLACENCGFVFYKTPDTVDPDRIPIKIKRNDKGIDSEDRIEVLKKYYKSIGLL